MDEELKELRREVGRLSTVVASGFSASTVLVESTQKTLTEIAAKLDGKIRDDAAKEAARSEKMGEFKAKLDGVSDLPNIRDRLAKLETSQDHIEKDVTGKHDVIKTHQESVEKDKDRKLDFEKLASEARVAKLRFWASIWTVAVPGILALLWQIFEVPGEPPPTPRPAAAEHSSHEGHGH